MDSTTRSTSNMNGESVDHIRREMDVTRAELDLTIGALQRKLAPDALKEKAKDAAYDATIGKVEIMVRQTGDGMLRTLKENPVPAAMAAIGIGWLVVRARAAAAPRQLALEPPSRVDRAMDTIGAKADDVKARVADTAEELKQRAGETAEQLQQRAGAIVDQAQIRGRQAGDAIERTFHENPLAIGLGVVAAGVLLGLVLPITRKEDEWMGPTRDKLASRAEQAAHEALGKVDDLAQRGVAKVSNQLGQPAEPASPPNGVTAPRVP